MISSTPGLPQQTFQLKPWLQQNLNQEHQTLDQFLDEIAADVKRDPQQATQNKLGIDLSPYLRVNDDDVTMLVDGLKARGIKDDKVLQSVLGSLVTTAVLTPMLQGLMGGLGHQAAPAGAPGLGDE